MKSMIVANEFIWPETGIGKKLINQHRALHELTESCEMVRLKLDRGLCKRYAVLEFDRAASLQAGAIRALLHTSGTPIGPYDVQMAGIALSKDLTIVTRNTREFERVPGLRVENWYEP